MRVFYVCALLKLFLAGGARRSGLEGDLGNRFGAAVGVFFLYLGIRDWLVVCVFGTAPLKRQMRQSPHSPPSSPLHLPYLPTYLPTYNLPPTTYPPTRCIDCGCLYYFPSRHDTIGSDWPGYLDLDGDDELTTILAGPASVWLETQ